MFITTWQLPWTHTLTYYILKKKTKKHSMLQYETKSILGLGFQVSISVLFL